MNDVTGVTAAVGLMLAFAGLFPGQGKQTFTGVITDSECSDGDHSHMRMGPTDAECVTACIEEHHGSYVLFDGKNTYALSDQKAPAKFAGKKVRVTGTLDAARKMIHVETIATTQPPPVFFRLNTGHASWVSARTIVAGSST